MAHQSENGERLVIQMLELSSLNDLPTPKSDVAEVWLFELPFGRTIGDAKNLETWFHALNAFAEQLHGESVVAILTSVQDAAETLPQLADALKFQLWVSVKLAEPFIHNDRQLREHHAALLILTKYRKSLRHTKTRIGYTYCPFCDKTTKDYGGKKHTYHEYGTLLSDVWRDITYTPGQPPTDVVVRLADIFGLAPYRCLTVVDLSRERSIQPGRVREVFPAVETAASREPQQSRLINGDVIGELQKLRSNSIDFCFADPPYNLDKRYDTWDDAIDIADYFKWCDAWLDELARVLRPGCTCAVLNIPIWAVRHFQHMKERLAFQSWIAWEGLSLPVRMIMPANYAIVCFSKGKPRPLPGLDRSSDRFEKHALSSLRENYCVRQSCMTARRRGGENDREQITDLWWDIHRLKHNSRRVDHPCQLPPALMHRLIALFTESDEVVLDPFNGAGTTTLCAEALGRRFVGIELSEKYHALAVSRHRMLADGGDPFEKDNSVPKTKNSRVKRVGGMRYEVPKRTLQLEARRVAQLLGRLPTHDELERHGQYPIRYYDEYFVSWGEVCAAARTTGMSETRKDSIVSQMIHQPTLFEVDLAKDS